MPPDPPRSGLTLSHLRPLTGMYTHTKIKHLGSCKQHTEQEHRRANANARAVGAVLNKKRKKNNIYLCHLEG